jgi:hypothetical protein
MKEYLELASGLLTPLIAIVTTMIAIFQYRLERQRWRLALFDKRYPIFERTMEFVAGIVSAGTVTNVSTNQFLRDTKDAALLFGPDVAAYLKTIYSKAVELRTHSALIDPLPVGDERARRAHAIQELNLWFGNQFEEVRRVFSAYIEIHEK